MLVDTSRVFGLVESWLIVIEVQDRQVDPQGKVDCIGRTLVCVWDARIPESKNYRFPVKLWLSLDNSVKSGFQCWIPWIPSRFRLDSETSVRDSRVCWTPQSWVVPPRGVTVLSDATTTDRADRILFGSIVPVNPNVSQ